MQRTSELAYNQVRLLEQINEARIASTSIVYLTIDSTIRIRGENYILLFNLMTKIEKKEQNKFLESKNPFLPPFLPGLHICELGDRHRLLFNKYSIYRNHVLLVTKEFEPQENNLTEADFRQVILVQGALSGVFYYNSGAESGASQKHKHVQFLPSESRGLPFVEMVESWLNEIQENPEINNNEILHHPQFNFLHGIRMLPELKDENALARIYLAAFDQLHKQVARQLGISYNVIGTERFIMLVPRKKERAFDEVSINSVGFVGSILFKSLQQYN